MSSASSLRRAILAAALVAAGTMVVAPRAQSAGVLRVCADPNNLPYSDAAHAGFENRIAEMAATELHRRLTYYWFPQRRGFIRNTLNANQCDVIIGLPTRSDMVRTTRPYYRSTYVFVSLRDRRLNLSSFDDRRLARLTVGVQVIGDDYQNAPAAQVLAARGLAARVHGYPVYGDYSKAMPTRGIVDAVVHGEIDTAVVWGPIAGYAAKHEPAPLALTRVRPDAGAGPTPFVFDISMGVRRADGALAARLDAFIVHKRREIDAVLRAYGVPLVELTTTSPRSQNEVPGS